MTWNFNVWVLHAWNWDWNGSSAFVISIICRSSNHRKDPLTETMHWTEQRFLQNLSWQIIQNLNNFAFQAINKFFASSIQFHRGLNSILHACKQTINIHSKLHGAAFRWKIKRHSLCHDWNHEKQNHISLDWVASCPPSASASRMSFSWKHMCALTKSNEQPRCWITQVCSDHRFYTSK